MGTHSTSADHPARLVLVGVRGYGQIHAERIARLADQGAVQLVAAVDPGVVADPPTVYGVDLYADLAKALAEVDPVDIVIIAAPLGEHFQLADIALRSGADVYLEKPPVASLEDFHRLLATEQETGRVVQIGFQSLGSRGLEMLDADAFGIGPVTRVSAVGAVVANSRLLEPFAMGGPPQPARPSRCRRGGHEPAGTRGDHGARDRRLSPT